MRKVLLFTVLLLTLAVVLTTPIAAKKEGGPGPPQKGEDKPVTFERHIYSNLGKSPILTVDRRGSNLAVYGDPALNFSAGMFPELFVGRHDKCVSLRINMSGTNTGEVWMGYYFDCQDFDDPLGRVSQVPHYYLDGSGTYTTDDEVTYAVELDAGIYKVEADRSGKQDKGALGFRHVQLEPPVLLYDILFDMTIGGN